MSETQNFYTDEMQLNSTQTMHGCVSTATTATRTGLHVAIYMYIAYLVYTAITAIISKKKKIRYIFNSPTLKKGGTGTTENTLQFSKVCVEKHRPFRYSNYRNPPASHQYYSGYSLTRGGRGVTQSDHLRRGSK